MGWTAPVFGAVCSGRKGVLRMFFSSLWWIALAVVLFWAVGAHNRLVRLRSAAAQAFGALDAHLVQLLALLGAYETAQAAVGAPAAPQRETLQTAATQCADALAIARAHPLRAAAVAPLVHALQVLEGAWAGVTEQLPTLAVPAGTEAWKVRWQQHQSLIAAARGQFAAAVAQHNTATGQFPAQLLAWLMGFKPAQPV